jgi:hypothetical protein
MDALVHDSESCQNFDKNGGKFYWATPRCQADEAREMWNGLCTQCCSCDPVAGTGSCTNQKQYCEAMDVSWMKAFCFGDGVLGGRGQCVCIQEIP